MFKPTESKTPQEYIESIPEPRKTDFLKIYSLIQKTLPHEKPFILSGMIGFIPYHYKTKTREGEWFIVGLSNRKDYISIYLCVADGKDYIAEKHKKDLPKASIGKSCIRIKKVEDIDLDILAKVIKEGVDHYKTYGFAF